MQSSSQIITTNKPTSSFLQAGCSSCCPPTNSVKALNGKISHSMDLLTPSSPGGLQTLSLTVNSSWLPWGRGAMPPISPLMPVPLWPVKTILHQYSSKVFLGRPSGDQTRLQISRKSLVKVNSHYHCSPPPCH